MVSSHKSWDPTSSLISQTMEGNEIQKRRKLDLKPFASFGIFETIATRWPSILKSAIEVVSLRL